MRLPALPFALRSLVPWHHLCQLLRSKGKTWLLDPQQNCKISPRIKEFLIEVNPSLLLQYGCTCSISVLVKYWPCQIMFCLFFLPAGLPPKNATKMIPNGYLIFEDETFLDSTVAKMNALRKSGQFCDVRLQVKNKEMNVLCSWFRVWRQAGNYSNRNVQFKLSYQNFRHH